VEHLPECLGCFEAVAGRKRHPLGGDLLRRQLAKRPITKDGSCLAEQVAELLDRHRLNIVLVQVRVDELRERQSPCDPAFPSEPLKLTLAAYD